jgi:ABC-2 type transport system permease protein
MTEELRSVRGVDPAGFGLPAPTPFDSNSDRRREWTVNWRAFIAAVRLNWIMESDWTDPVLFLIYTVAKPLGSLLLLVAMLEIVGGGGKAELRSFIVVGSVLWSIVLSGLSGPAWMILDAREFSQTLKYIYIAPGNFLAGVLGRGVAQMAIGSMAAAITLAVGVLALGVPVGIDRVDWLLLAATTLVGVPANLAIGLMLAANCLHTRQESWSYPEAAGGALFLLSGVVFPLSVLPATVQVLGLVTPMSWWMEGVRHAVMPGGLSGIGGPGSLYTSLTGMPSPSSAEILVGLTATAVVTVLVGVIVFRASERRARRRGLLDVTTGS